MENIINNKIEFFLSFMIIHLKRFIGKTWVELKSQMNFDFLIYYIKIDIILQIIIEYLHNDVDHLQITYIP